jgi:hypothetical protein
VRFLCRGRPVLPRQNLRVRRLDSQFDFIANYEVVPLDRLDRSGGKQAYGFPDAVPLDPQQELADLPILEVRPGRGDPWVGVFYGVEYGVPPAASGRLIGWPDQWSICVVYTGGAVVMRADDPARTYEINAYPVTGALVGPEREMVVFSDFTNLVAYGPDGLLWKSPRLALDDLRVQAFDGDVLRVEGFFGGRKLDEFAVDIATGEPNGQPFHP